MVHKSWLLLPLTVLLMGCSAHKTTTAQTTSSTASEQDGKYNGVTLDVARRHYQVGTLQKFIQLVGIITVGLFSCT